MADLEGATLEEALEEVIHVADFLARCGENQLATRLVERFKHYRHLIEQGELYLDEEGELDDEGERDPDQA